MTTVMNSFQCLVDDQTIAVDFFVVVHGGGLFTKQ